MYNVRKSVTHKKVISNRNLIVKYLSFSNVIFTMKMIDSIHYGAIYSIYEPYGDGSISIYYHMNNEMVDMSVSYKSFYVNDGIHIKPSEELKSYYRKVNSMISSLSLQRS